MRRDIDEALQNWPYEPEQGEVAVREVRAKDGRNVLQIRIELGLLQLEVTHRPDGVKPHGYDTYLDYLKTRARVREALQGSGTADTPWTMSRNHCHQVDREFVQFYQRRIAWLALQKYQKALQDADHTLALMDFVKVHGPSEEYVNSHERYRGLVLFHRTQAAAALALESHQPDEAIDAIHAGRDRIAVHVQSCPEDEDSESLIEQLNRLEVEIRKNFSVPKTLKEQLDEAVASEDYEKAAQLRDLIRERHA